MLTYNYAPISDQKMAPPDYPYVTLNREAYSSNSSCLLYDPPIEEFAVARTDLKAAGAKATFEAIAGPSIILCTEGSGKISVGPKTETLNEGYVYFIGATAEAILESDSSNFVTYRAFCELADDAKNGNH
jgi:mannose-6-phosphate isomerase